MSWYEKRPNFSATWNNTVCFAVVQNLQRDFTYVIVADYTHNDALMKVRVELILVLFLLSLIFGGVHLLRFFFLPSGSTYTPLVAVGVDIHTVDEVFYAQRIQKAAFGNLLVGDRHFFEHRNEAFIYPTFTPFLFGLITRFLGDISFTFILADFIFPACSFLLLYILLYWGTHNRLVALTGSITALFYDIFQEMIAAIVRLDPLYFLKRIYIGDGRVLHISRFEAQEFIFPFVLCGVLLLWVSINKKKKILALVSGVIFGLQPYIYPYSTLFYGLGACLLFMQYLFQKDWTKLQYVVIAITTGILLIIPYGITYQQFLQLPVSADVFSRMSIIEYYSPIQIVRQFGHYFIFVGLSFYISRKNQILRFSSLYLFGILLALGFFPFGKIYHLDIYLKIWFPVVLFMLAHEVFCKIKRIHRATIIRKIYFGGLLFVFLIILGGGSIKHFSSAIASKGKFTIDKSVLDSYTWIKKNTSPDSVILTPSLRTNRELPAYVPNYIFLGRADFTYAPTRELLERAYLAYQYFGYTQTDVTRVFSGLSQGVSLPHKAPYTAEQIEELGIYHYLGFNGAEKEYQERLFGAEYGLAGLLVQYTQTPRMSAAQLATKYRLDYVYVGPAEMSLIRSDIDQDTSLKQVYKNNSVKIYQVLH